MLRFCFFILRLRSLCCFWFPPSFLLFRIGRLFSCLLFLSILLQTSKHGLQIVFYLLEIWFVRLHFHVRLVRRLNIALIFGIVFFIFGFLGCFDVAGLFREHCFQIFFHLFEHLSWRCTGALSGNHILLHLSFALSPLRCALLRRVGDFRGAGKVLLFNQMVDFQSGSFRRMLVGSAHILRHIGGC